MRPQNKLSLWQAVIFTLAVYLITLLLVNASVQAQSATCANSDTLVIDTSTKTYKCLTPGALPAGTGTTMIIANASSTGTTLNKFAKLTGAPSTAVISSNGDTENAIGIVTAGAGTTGNATITILGQVSCVFDGATTAGNYVVIAATGGGCHDAGSSYPTSGATYGRVLSTNGSGGTYVMELMTPDIAFQNAGNGKSKPGGSAFSTQYNNSNQFGGTGPGTAGQVLTSTGASSAPTYQTPSAGAATLTRLYVPIFQGGAASTGIGSANQVRCMQFPVYGTITVNKIAFRTVVGTGGTNGAVGVYSLAGSRLIDSGPKSSAGSGSYLETTLGAAVILTPGEYLWCQTADSTSPTFMSVSTAVGMLTLYTQNQTTAIYSAANASSAGQLPATLGTLTALGVGADMIFAGLLVN